MKLFHSQDLLPTAWQLAAGGGNVYVFNPALIRFDGGLLLAYRVVLGDGRRRLALCRLDDDFNIVAGSVVPLSDAIVDAGDWHADPRFCVFDGRLLLHFNSGGQAPNQIYLLELDAQSLLPKQAARPLWLKSARQRVEKNWLLFGHEGALYAVYTIAPQVVLRVHLDGDAVWCEAVAQTPWDDSEYRRRFGALRGGTPPVRVGDHYFAFFHSVHRVPGWRRIWQRLRYGRGQRLWRYVVGFYGFAASPPFAPQCLVPMPVLLPPPRSGAPLLNRAVDRVAYPCGAVCEGGEWIVAYGINDEACALARFQHQDLLAKAVPVTLAAADHGRAQS